MSFVEFVTPGPTVIGDHQRLRNRGTDDAHDQYSLTSHTHLALVRTVTHAQATVASSTSASVFDWGGGALTSTFTKQSASTSLVVRVDLTVYLSAVAAVRVGVSIAGVDHMLNTFVNETTSHKMRSFGVQVDGLDAGSIAVTARVASNGVATLFTDANDYGVLDIAEVYA